MESRNRRVKAGFASHGKKISVTEDATIVCIELYFLGYQTSFVPADYRFESFHHNQAFDLFERQCGCRCITQPKSPHHDVPSVTAQLT